MTQLALDLHPLTTPDYEPDLTLGERYDLFIAENPQVLDVFESLAEQWLNAGHARCGMKAVAETARWQTGIRMGSGGWKVNNSFVSFIARDILARRPEWHGRIELRTQRAAA